MLIRQPQRWLFRLLSVIVLLGSGSDVGGVRADTCVPDGSLTWVSGLPRKEVAAQVEAALAQANMQAQDLGIRAGDPGAAQWDGPQGLRDRV
jgi:hypothetical protein